MLYAGMYFWPHVGHWFHTGASANASNKMSILWLRMHCECNWLYYFCWISKMSWRWSFESRFAKRRGGSASLSSPVLIICSSTCHLGGISSSTMQLPVPNTRSYGWFFWGARGLVSRGVLSFEGGVSSLTGWFPWTKWGGDKGSFSGP